MIASAREPLLSEVDDQETRVELVTFLKRRGDHPRIGREFVIGKRPLEEGPQAQGDLQTVLFLGRPFGGKVHGKPLLRGGSEHRF